MGELILNALSEAQSRNRLINEKRLLRFRRGVLATGIGVAILLVHGSILSTCDPDIPSETGSAPPGSAPPGSAAERGGDKGRQEVAAASGLLALGLAIFGLRRRV